MTDISMNHYGTLRDFRFSDRDTDDIRGSDIYGINNEKLGEIDDIVFDHATGDIRYVVVDAGGWLSSDLFLIPAQKLKPSFDHEGDFEASLTKEQIKQFPEYDEDNLKNQDRWKDYESRYSAGWEDGEVMYRKDAPDKIVTPAADEVRSSRATDINRGSDVRRSNSHLGERWNNFENRVRNDRARIVGTCNVCSIGPSSTAADMDRKRKVG